MPTVLDDPRFTPVATGIFRERFGPLGKDAQFSQKKLCLAATDAAFLIELLYGLSLRADCSYVKYKTRAHDGMYLGRCFLQTDQAASELCQELKDHPRLLVSLQDDTWFAQFRDPTDSTFGVWSDWPRHEPEVSAILEAAFKRAAEARAVKALRAARADVISLVAQLAPEQRGRDPWPVAGYVMLSPVTIDELTRPRGLGLGPLAVAPAYQARGYGSALVRAALRRARILGYSYVVVLGDPGYYTRFGFVPASEFGLAYPDAALGPHFQVVELSSGALTGFGGIVHYHSALEL